MCTLRAPVAHGALQTTESGAIVRISQSLQTWFSPGAPEKVSATMCTSYALMSWPSCAGSRMTGVATERVAESPTWPAAAANSTNTKSARRLITAQTRTYGTAVGAAGTTAGGADSEIRTRPGRAPVG